MYSSFRNCPTCGCKVEHVSIQSQAHANNLADRSNKAQKLCRSCIATKVNNRRWSNPSQREQQSKRFLANNPSKGKPAWNRGVPRDEATKSKIKQTVIERGGRKGDRNANYGKFKVHNINADFKNYNNRVRVLTERIKHLIPNYDQSKRGKVGIPGAHQIDHIKSIIDCWYDNWTPEQAADVTNLRFISWEENLKVRKWKKKRSLE